MYHPYAQTISIASDSWLIDEVFSEYEFKGQRSITIQASPAQIFAAIRAVTLADMPVAAALIWLRYLPSRKFARYWLVIGPVSWFMLGILLGAIRRRLEREAIALAIG